MSVILCICVDALLLYFIALKYHSNMPCNKNIRVTLKTAN